MLMVGFKFIVIVLKFCIAMYSGIMRKNLPTGPGTFFTKVTGKNKMKGEFLAAKSDGTTKWSFGKINKH